MRAAIYARVSTKDQSCDMQMRDLRAYCAARGFTIIREYIDIGQSGAKDSRPELNELMADARKRKLDSILVWRFDRFARSTKHLLLALEEFRSLGIQFISYQENIDTSSPLGQALTIRTIITQGLYRMRWAWFQKFFWRVLKPVVIGGALLFVLNWARRMR